MASFGYLTRGAMKRFCFVALSLFLIFGTSACAVRKASHVNPTEPIAIVGEYEFSFVGLGVGHVVLYLPGSLNLGPLQESMYIEPKGSFVFNDDSTFRILLRMVGSPINEHGGIYNLERKDLGDPIDEVRGTYKITSNNTIILQTPYGEFKYIFSLSNPYQNYIMLGLMPVDRPLQIGDRHSTQGESVIDMMRLGREKTK